MNSPTELTGELASLRITREEAPPPTRGWLKVALVVLGLAAVLGTLAFVFRDRLDVKTVDTAPIVLVQPGQEAPLFVATATLTAPVTDTLAPRTPGRLAKRMVDEGDEVLSGQPVAMLDPTDLRLALTQARADVAAAEARVGASRVAVKTAEVRHERAEKLFRGGAGTESTSVDAALDLDTARAQVQVTEADLGLARARLATAEKNLEDATLRAPFHGVVLRILAQPGDYISTAASQGAMQLADLSSLEVDAEVAEANLAKLVVRMPVEVRLDALPSQGIPGHVFAVRPNVDVAKATAIVKVRLEPPPGSLKLPLFPGMSCRVNFLSHEPDLEALQRAPQLEVPASAIVREGERLAVLVVDKDGLVRSVAVVTGGTNGERVVLKDGPVAGTLVVTAPERVHPGDRVHLPANN